MHFLRTLFFILIGIIPIQLFSQNLVLNPGFEDFTKCPHGHAIYGEVLSTLYWFSPNIGTPDYFNVCSKSESNPGINWAGRCDDYSGNGYVGIIAFMRYKNYREYLGAELLHPLDSGVKYSMQFSFRLSSYSKISSGRIGLALSDKRLNIRNDKSIELDEAILAMPDSGIVQQTGLWQTANGEYVAKGGERFIYIGNFSTQQETPFYKIQFGGNHEPMLSTASYFYIDDVVVQRQVIFEPDIPVALIPDNPFEQDSLIVLKNVQFAYNSDLLNNISQSELNKLLQFLLKHSQSKIEILGHTDDQGSADYNNQLSLRRAKSVTSYLQENGIEKFRMQAFGFGKTMPLIDSKDEFARGINRRVEVKLIK